MPGVWTADACSAAGSPLRNIPVSQRPQGAQGSAPGEGCASHVGDRAESEVPEDLASHWLANRPRDRRLISNKSPGGLPTGVSFNKGAMKQVRENASLMEARPEVRAVRPRGEPDLMARLEPLGPRVPRIACSRRRPLALRLSGPRNLGTRGITHKQPIYCSAGERTISLTCCDGYRFSLGCPGSCEPANYGR